MKIGYYAIFDYEDQDNCEYGIGVTFPDLNNAATCGRNLEECIKFAKEVLILNTFDLCVKNLPRATEKDEFKLKDTQKLYFIEYETDEIFVVIQDKPFEDNDRKA